MDLLIGLNNMEVQPEEVAREEGMSLWKSKLGPGYLLGGTHPEIWLGCPERLAAGALEISLATDPAFQQASHHTQLVRGENENFLKAEAENLEQEKARADKAESEVAKQVARTHEAVAQMNLASDEKWAMVEQLRVEQKYRLALKAQLSSLNAKVCSLKESEEVLLAANKELREVKNYATAVDEDENYATAAAEVENYEKDLSQTNKEVSSSEDSDDESSAAEETKPRIENNEKSRPYYQSPQN